METTLDQSTNIPPLRRFGAGIGKAVDYMSSMFGFLGGIMLLLSAFVISYEVIARYAFDSPTGWTFETSILLVLTGVFLTVSYGLKEGSHVNVEAFVHYLPAKVCMVLEIISYLFVLGYSLLFVHYSFDMLTHSFTIAEKSSQMFLPLWPVKAAFFLSFTMLALQSVRLLVAKVSQLAEANQEQSGRRGTVITVLGFIFVFSLGVISMYFSPVGGLTLLLMIMLFAGIPIGFTITITGAFGMALLLGVERGIAAIPQMTYMVWNDFSVAALPLFVFLGYIMYRSGLANDLFDFARAWIGHIPGGLAVTTMVVCGIFAAISGSSVANALTVGLIAIPAMLSYKYDRKMAGGLVAVGGTLGVLIPPSAAMLLIGIATQESVGKLFMAGVIPGILALFLFSIVAVWQCKKTGDYEPLPKATFKERMIGTKAASGSLLMPVLMLGGIYSGAFTPTEAAAVAVIYALVYSLLSKRIKMQEFYDVIKDSTKSVAMLVILVAGGLALANVSTMLQIPQMAAEYVISASWPGWMVILGALVLIFLLGTALEGGVIVLLTMPILAPVVSALGYDVIWFAVLVVICTEIGMISPPVGLNVFVVKQVSGISTMDVLEGSIPYVLILVLLMLLVALFPALALWLPSTM
ncbi:MAG: TRAP transporter large permease subunit [Clostridia bacterium]|nr:TRAP transporter large permease subunit [Clostridia bacterium]